MNFNSFCISRVIQHYALHQLKSIQSGTADELQVIQRSMHSSYTRSAVTIESQHCTRTLELRLLKYSCAVQLQKEQKFMHNGRITSVTALVLHKISTGVDLPCCKYPVSVMSRPFSFYIRTSTAFFHQRKMLQWRDMNGLRYYDVIVFFKPCPRIVKAGILYLDTLFINHKSFWTHSKDCKTPVYEITAAQILKFVLPSTFTEKTTWQKSYNGFRGLLPSIYALYLLLGLKIITALDVKRLHWSFLKLWRKKSRSELKQKRKRRNSEFCAFSVVLRFVWMVFWIKHRNICSKKWLSSSYTCLCGLVWTHCFPVLEGKSHCFLCLSESEVIALPACAVLQALQYYPKTKKKRDAAALFCEKPKPTTHFLSWVLFFFPGR